MKKCPYCAEEIQDEAIKCRYCGEFLDGSRPPEAPEEKLLWCFRITPIVLVALSVPPMALPMIWWHPKLSMPWKIMLTVVVLILTWLFYVAIVGFFKAWDDAVKELEGSGLRF